MFKKKINFYLWIHLIEFNAYTLTWNYVHLPTVTKITHVQSYVEDGVCIIALDATCILFLASMYVLHMICCFYLLLHIDLSHIVKWFSFAFCVVIINNVVYCNLHIYVYVMKRKKSCTYCMKNGKKKKNTWKETGWNSTNSLTYVTSKCILKLIRISLIYLYSEQSVFTSEMKFWYVHDFQKHYLYFKTQCVYKYSVMVPLVSPFLMHTALPNFISYYYR